MGSESAMRDPATAFSPGFWEDVTELLSAGRYRDAAKLLKKTEASADANGNRALAAVLNATCQICLAGHDFRADVNHHRQAYTAATQREQQLREHLQTLVNIIAGNEIEPGSEQATGFPFNVASSSQQKGRIPAILARLQGLLSRDDKAGASADTLSTPSAAHREAEQPQDETALISRKPTLFRSTSPEFSSEPPRQAERRPVHDRPSLAVYCLGPFAVYQNDMPITEWNGLKGLTILKYMMAQRGKPIAKETLMEVVWPDADPESARRNLHQAMYSLRQTLRQAEPDFQHISFHNDSYRFNREMNIWIDFVQFEGYVKEGQRQETNGKELEALRAFAVAEELYQGDFLEEDLYEEWATGQRERLKSLYLETVDRLTEHFLNHEEYTAATALCHKALAQDSCYEVAHRRLMECHIGQGQRHLAVRQYQICSRLLAEELDLEPSPETEALFRRIAGNG